MSYIIVGCLVDILNKGVFKDHTNMVGFENSRRRPNHNLELSLTSNNSNVNIYKKLMIDVLW